MYAMTCKRYFPDHKIRPRQCKKEEDRKIALVNLHAKIALIFLTINPIINKNYMAYLVGFILTIARLAQYLKIN